MKAKFCNVIFPEQGRLGAVVRAVSLSHQVVGSKQPLRRFCWGKACLGLSLPQTPLMWEPPALGLPFFSYVNQTHEKIEWDDPIQSHPMNQIHS